MISTLISLVSVILDTDFKVLVNACCVSTCVAGTKKTYPAYGGFYNNRYTTVTFTGSQSNPVIGAP